MNTNRRGRDQRGFTLVELMVAITIALFLLGGLFATVQSTRRTYGNQNLLAQLQDNERLAMTLMGGVIETAGYFPNPVLNQNTIVFPTDAVFAAAGQTIIGGTNAAGDTVTVRYAAALNDNAYNCIGGTNTVLAPYQVWENAFRVINNQLVCTINGTDYPLITAGVNNAGVATLGVKNMSILYGVTASTGASTGSCTDTYLTTAQMIAAAAGTIPGIWSQVCSVSVTLTFINPITPTAAGISITRVIAIMGKAGVNS
ncbi:MAG TPA: prepilin-type N-terminal cleavage/methylation domain-containing protein [Steroidobacteraceae bacterium]|jgi:type IV pilus assembly protein PilW